MRFSYDPKADALYIRFNEGTIDETDEVFPGIMLDFDMEGNPVGLEILNASKKLGKPPLTVELEIPGKLGTQGDGSFVSSGIVHKRTIAKGTDSSSR